ncbi:phosphatase [Streptomyces sp. NPDC047985]|uniref:phosphatase n=1 Tax=Streptomyces sp. NPDC047985 TaxID=3155384 RepID=UPI003417FE07
MSSTGALRAHLPRARLAGPVATTWEASLRSYRLFAARDPRMTLGLSPEGNGDEPDLLRLMTDKCGVCDDPVLVPGPDMIDPMRTLAGLEAFAGRLSKAVSRRSPVLFETGHPHRLLGFYAALADAASAVGCPVLTPAQGRCIDITTRFGVRTSRLDYVRGVAMVREPGARNPGDGTGAHTHSPLSVRVVLDVAAASDGRLPGLVVGDYGWVCGAGQPGIEAIGQADTDDSALFVGEALGEGVGFAVSLDDAVRSAASLLLTRHVLDRACLSQ